MEAFTANNSHHLLVFAARICFLLEQKSFTQRMVGFENHTAVIFGIIGNNLISYYHFIHGNFLQVTLCHHCKLALFVSCDVGFSLK